MGFLSPYFDPFDDETNPYGLKTIFALFGCFSFAFALVGAILPYSKYPQYDIPVLFCLKSGAVLFGMDLFLFPKITNWRAVYKTWDENVKADLDRQVPPALQNSKFFKGLLLCVLFIIAYCIFSTLPRAGEAKILETKIELLKILAGAAFFVGMLIPWFFIKKCIVKVFKL